MRPVKDSDVNFYICHQCKRREKWNNNWGWCFEFFGKGYAGYEIQRHFCSEACHVKWKSKKKKPLKTN